QKMALCLDAREQEILTLRYGLEGRPPLAQREVAAHLGISRSYVSRLEKKALSKLRTQYEITAF
ncbi:MAG: RNA polymerase subunit sigma-70, partial [Oscillospiraceae bacterium]|nr:RNA polymerase subunit sigma-70 [Oscillospiraceae bacterium]